MYILPRAWFPSALFKVQQLILNSGPSKVRECRKFHQYSCLGLIIIIMLMLAVIASDGFQNAIGRFQYIWLAILLILWLDHWNNLRSIWSLLAYQGISPWVKIRSVFCQCLPCFKEKQIKKNYPHSSCWSMFLPAQMQFPSSSLIMPFC